MHKAKTCRLGHPCTPRTFRQALACRTQHHPTLSAEEIADRAEVQLRRLHRWSNDNEPHEQIPAQALIRVCAVTGSWDLLDFLLDQHGLHVVMTTRTGARDLVRETMDLPVAMGRAIEEVQRASADGRLDDDEARQIRTRLREVRRELDDVETVVDNQVRTA